MASNITVSSYSYNAGTNETTITFNESGLAYAPGGTLTVGGQTLTIVDGNNNNTYIVSGQYGSIAQGDAVTYDAGNSYPPATTFGFVNEVNGTTIFTFAINNYVVRDPAGSYGVKAGDTVTYNNVTLAVGSVAGQYITLNSTYPSTPIAGDAFVYVESKGGGGNQGGGGGGGGGGGASPVAKQYLQHNDAGASESASPTFLVATGAEFLGSIAMEENKITGLGAGVDPTDAVNVSQLESYVSGQISAADSVNDAAVSVIESRVTVLESDLSSETSARESAIDNEASIRLAADQSLASDLSDEVSRATSAESSLELRLSNEESVRLSAINNEASIRLAADQSLASDLSAEVSDRAAAVSSEASLRVSGDQSLSTLISSEASARVAGDSSVLSAAESYTDSAIAALVNSAPEILDTLGEIAAAISADESLAVTLVSQIASLGTELSVEESRASSAEGSLATAFSTADSAEASARASADASLASAFSSADASLASAFSAADSVEKSRAQSVEASLASQLSTEITDRSAAVSTEASLRVAGDASLSTRLSTEESVRASADLSLQSRVSTEESRAAAAEASLSVALSSAISSEVSRADVDYVNVSGDSMTGGLNITNPNGAGLVVNVGSSLTGIQVQPVDQNSAEYVDISENEIAVLNANGQLALSTNILAGKITLMAAGSANYAVNPEEVPVYAQLTDLSSAVSSQMSSASTSLVTALSSEASTRLAADQSLSTLISAEDSSRTAADSSLTSALSGEASTRLAADSSLTVRVSSEESARVSAFLSIADVYVNVSGDTMTGQLTVDNGSQSEGVVYVGSGFVRVLDASNAAWMPSLPQDLATKAYVDQEVGAEESTRIVADDSLASSLSTQMSSEASARVAGDSSVQANLVTEHSNRIVSENSIISLINSEASRAEAEESTLWSGLVSETGARTLADASLAAAISFIASNVDPAAIDSLTEIVSAFQAADSNINGAITSLATANSVATSAEASRALAAEASIAANLSSEIVARASDVDAEESRAMAAESSLNSALSSELSSRISGDLSLTNRVSAEESNRLAGDSSIAANLSSEVSRATSVEGSLASDINQEVADRISAANSLNTAISAEKTRAEGAEGSIAANLSSEVSSRISGDLSLSAALSSEVSNRIADVDAEQARAESVEASLSSALSGEVSRAGSAELSLSNQISNAIADEASYRAAADDALDLRIHDIENYYLDKRVGGVVTGSLALADANGGYAIAVDPSLLTINVPATVNNDLSIYDNNLAVYDAQQNEKFIVQPNDSVVVNLPMQVSSSLTIGQWGIELAPVVKTVQTIGAPNQTVTSDFAMFDDLANYTGVIQADFRVVACSTSGPQGMSGEYRMTAYCNGGLMSQVAVVELDQVMIGNANLDVDIMSDGKVRVYAISQGSSYRWHVQRVKMVAINALGQVK